MLIIYKLADGIIIDNQGINSNFPNGVEDVKPLIDFIISTQGGKSEDYGVFRLNDTEDYEIVARTFTHEYTIQNGEIVFGVEKPIPVPEPQSPTETELLTDYIIDVDYRVTMIELGL